MFKFELVVVPPGGGETEFTVEIKTQRIPQTTEYIQLKEEDGISLFLVTNVISVYEDNDEVPIKDFIEKGISVEVEPVDYEFQSPSQARMVERFKQQGYPVKSWIPTSY